MLDYTSRLFTPDKSKQVVRRTKLNELEAENLRQYKTLFDGMAQGVFTQLADGTLVDVNPAALEMFGLDRDQFFGRTSFSPGWKVVNEDGTDLLPEQHPSMIALRTGLPLRDTVVGVYNPNKESFVWLITNAIPVIREEEDTPYQVFVTLQDITERKKAEEGLLKSNNRFQNITAQSPLPIVITDVKGDIEFFNNKFIEVFGYTLDDISNSEQWWIAAYPDEAYRQKVQESWTKAIDKALKNGTQMETQEWDITCKNGSVRCAEFDMTPLGDISVIVMNDITERKRAEALIKESNEELDAFVHTVAHDLRAPLTPIMGYAEILREEYNEQLDEQGLSYLAEIEKAGTRMLALMEGLLSLAKSGTIKRPIKFVPTDKVVARVIKNLEPNIAATRAILRINPLPPIHVPKTFLAQIFDNLIGNALRYAGNSGGLIEVGGEQAGKQIRFFVRDHGLGISEQERKHIFEIFYRGTNKGKVKGSGIGLAIVYKIARNYGGRAWVEETHGGGCTFWVEMEDASPP
jgi:PAS domain S-box-containing protein